MVRAVEYISSRLCHSLVLQHISRPVKMGITFLFFLLIIMQSVAQTVIHLPEAIEMALKNNLSVSNERLKTEYAKVLISSAANIPPTQLNTEFGQVNSSYFDTKIIVSQSFSMPAVYQKQKQLFSKEWEAAMMNVSLREYELKRVVTETFYNHVYLQRKSALLKSMDSLYANLLQRANIRLQKGESNILEKTTFETQSTAIQLQQEQATQQMLMLEEIFRLLLNTDNRYIPTVSVLTLNDDTLLNFESIQEHPALKVAELQQQIVKVHTDVERSKLLPELMVGYSNNSFQGSGPDNNVYNAGERFHSGQIGIGIPIFTGAQKARIKAGRINEQVAANNYQIEKQALQNAYLKYYAQYNHLRQMLGEYHNRYLKNISTIHETANKQFLNGQINYLEYVMLINQAISIQNTYIDLQNDYNKSVISLIYLNK